MALQILFVLVLVGVAFWAVEQAPMSAPFRVAVRAVGVLVVVWLLFRLVATMLPAFP